MRGSKSHNVQKEKPQWGAVLALEPVFLKPSVGKKVQSSSLPSIGSSCSPHDHPLHSPVLTQWFLDMHARCSLHSAHGSCRLLMVSSSSWSQLTEFALIMAFIHIRASLHLIYYTAPLSPTNSEC